MLPRYRKDCVTGIMFGEQKVSYSGVQPSGNLTIGNYLGAIRNFAEYSEKYKTFYYFAKQNT